MSPLEQDRADPDPITPARIQLNWDSPGADRAVSRTRTLSARLGCLFLVALGMGAIILRLAWIASPPDEASSRAHPSNRSSGEPSATASSAAPSPPAPAPFRQTRRARLRREAQDILAQLMKRQQSLRQIGVETWAAEEYNTALAQAAAGDSAYRRRQFADATASYRRALSALQTLQARSERVFAQALAQGHRALAAGNAEAAARAFQTALRIRPDNPEARKGSRRAQTLDEVSALTARGDQALRQGRLEQARRWYRRALKLDDRAKTSLQQVNRQLAERRFRQLMSQGYAALDANELTRAREYFIQAVRIQPHAGEAGEALDQVQYQIASNRIAYLLKQAGRAEQAEQWQAAEKHYRAALALDPNLAPARQGRQYAAHRLRLDQRLARTIARPERLAFAEVFHEAERLLQQARRLNPRSPRLNAQVATLTQLLQQAATPVEVLFRSDNQTDVTVYKVGHWGRFETRRTALRPGRYVAVGSRAGYRDVRVEFVVRAASPPTPVVIRAAEKIAF